MNSFIIAATRTALGNIATARQLAQQPTATVPAPATPPLVPTTTAPPPLPGVTPPPPPLTPPVSSAAVATDFSPAMNVQDAAISPDPTALTGAKLTPEQQAANRAKMLKLVGAAVLIWLILDATGR